MPVYLVRHANAGNRYEWTGLELERPLTRSGRRQADAIAQRLRTERVTRLLSSPYLRCRQTLEPLATALDLPIEITPELAEGLDFNAVVELLERLPEQSVLCSHGDVIPAVVRALQWRGLVLDGPTDTRKAAIWVLERVGRDCWARASVIAPPKTGLLR